MGIILGHAVSMVSIGSQDHHDRPSRDSRTLASSRLPSVLAVEIPLSWRPTEDRCGTARADPADERRKFLVGSAAHSWRVAQARLRGRSVQRREVYGPRSQGWRTFLRNHAPDIAAMDLFGVPTIGFDLLYVLVIVRLARRDLVRIDATPHPTAEHARSRRHSLGMRLRAT